MNYDQRYLVTVRMKNTGYQEWRPGDVNLVQDNGDINWQPTSTFNTSLVFPGQTYDFRFFVNPKSCVFGGIFGCYATNFNWQMTVWRFPMVRGRVRFGAITPKAGLSLGYYVEPPKPSAVPPGYVGMVSVVPPGTTRPPPPPLTNFPSHIY